MQVPSLKKQSRRPVDDAGEPIRTIDLRDLPAEEDTSGQAMRRFVRQLRHAARREGGLSRRGQLVVAILIVLFLVGWNMFRSRIPLPAGGSLPAFFALLAVSTGASWYVTRRIGLRIRGSGIARAVAARGFCGGCGYELREAALKRPRFVDCPECAARWTPDRLLAAPLEQTTWDTLGKRHGRVPTSRRLAHDDRGAIIRRIRSVPWRAPAAGRQSWVKDQKKLMRRARRRSGLIWRLLATLFVSLPFIYLVVAIFATDAVSADVIPTAVLILLSGLALVGAVAVWSGETGVANQRYLRRVVRADVCAACAHSLRDIQADGDGFRVCPKCGSSWRTVGPGV